MSIEKLLITYVYINMAFFDPEYHVMKLSEQIHRNPVWSSG